MMARSWRNPGLPMVVDDVALRPLASRLILEAGVATTTAVTSARPREGKTTVVISLARALESYAGRRVLVVDWDIHRPRLHAVYGLPQEPGSMDVLRGTLRPREAIYIAASGTLAVLAAGRPREPLKGGPLKFASFGPAGLISLLPLLRAMEFDHILIDLPALLTCPEAVQVAGLCTQTLIVTRAGQTDRDDACRVRDGLIEAGALIAGVVLNDAA